MRMALHLVAMPLAYPLHPSSQLGYLHGYVGAAFDKRIPVRSHHAFLPILHDFAGANMATFFRDYSLVGEEILYLCCCLASRQHGEAGWLPVDTFDDALARYNNYSGSLENDSQQTLVPISDGQVAALTAAMERYVERILEPALEPAVLNVIGLTASFCQVFGSVFAARHLRRISRKPMLFLFGGSSFSLPEGSRTLAAWGVDGLIVTGSGEQPLHSLLEALLALEEGEEAAAILAIIQQRSLTNIARVGEPHQPLSLAMPVGYMQTLPDPDYHDYFADLRALCSDDRAFSFACSNLVSLPLEGSRGCFAKCDFCHNPNITSEFRSLTGQEVAVRTLRMTEQYAVRDVTFVDSVSNTWAEAYADHLLGLERRIQAFMELRVHAPEVFWTKLSLAGATTLQLGIEAISDPLLKSMRKATTAIQNLAATKYMAEMGTQDASNLIIHHPRSTAADVAETKRVMRLLEHLPVFNLSRFVVSYASPLYNELAEGRKEALSRGFDWLPPELQAYGWPRHLSYTWPNAWSDPDAVQAWLEFQAWYADHLNELAARHLKPTFTVLRKPDGLYLQDTRFGQDRLSVLRDLEAAVYDACHRPRKARQLAEELDLSIVEIQPCLDALEDSRALILIGETYLSIALRPSAELIANYVVELGASPRRTSGAATDVHSMR